MPILKLFGFTIFIWRTPPNESEKKVLMRLANHYHRCAMEAHWEGRLKQAYLFGNLAVVYENSARELKS